METKCNSILQQLNTIGSHVHFSDDEEPPAPIALTDFFIKNDDYYSQKRIFALEAKSGEHFEDKLVELYPQKIATTYVKLKSSIRAEIISTRLEQRSGETSKRKTRLKAHSLEIHNDNEYYFSRKYLIQLGNTKRTVHIQ